MLCNDYYYFSTTIPFLLAIDSVRPTIICKFLFFCVTSRLRVKDTSRRKLRCDFQCPGDYFSHFCLTLALPLSRFLFFFRILYITRSESTCRVLAYSLDYSTLYVSSFSLARLRFIMYFISFTWVIFHALLLNICSTFSIEHLSSEKCDKIIGSSFHLFSLHNQIKTNGFVACRFLNRRSPPSNWI